MNMTPDTLIDYFMAHGERIPWVTPAEVMYADYVDFETGCRRQPESIKAFIRQMLKEKVTLCRLPDGSLGLVGAVPRSRAKGNDND